MEPSEKKLRLINNELNNMIAAARAINRLMKVEGDDECAGFQCDTCPIETTNIQCGMVDCIAQEEFR